MSEFGKLNFSTSFNPTSAFPIDARCYFTSLEDAQDAAAIAEEVGSSNTVYYYGMKLLVDDGTVAVWYTITRNGELAIDSQNGASYVFQTEAPSDTNVLWIDPSDETTNETEYITNAVNEIDALIGGDV